MSAQAREEWQEANQRYLMDRIDELRARIERPGDNTIPALPGSWGHEIPPAIEHLSRVFGLTEFERDVVLLCAGVELESSFAELCARSSGVAARSPVTFAFALAALREPHWSALTPVSALRYWHLIEVFARDSLTQGAIKLDERVLHHLAGVDHLDERVRAVTRTLPLEDNLHPCERRAASRIADQWLAPVHASAIPVAQICSQDAGATLRAAAAACNALGLVAYCIHARDVPANASDRMVLARLCEREAALTRRIFLLDTFGVRAELQEVLASFADQFDGRLIVVGAASLQGLRRPTLRFDLERGTARDRREAWSAALGPLATERLNGSVERVAEHFDLDGSAIRSVVTSLRANDSMEDLDAHLWQRCREQTRGRLDELAERIEPSATWDDLVLPDTQLTLLREVSVHVREHRRVFDEWGFASKSTRGVGTSALFAGPSGTGKTMAAEVLANDLKLDLYRIDLSRVVNKYIGETEKNLATIFDVGERSGAILLFDEADALFGRRSEVRDSHDRYANIEVSYLLQRMEAYRGGVAILTTNLKNALDTAFLRRLRFVVQFPFPDAEQRAEIWRRIFPASAPLHALDVSKLARLNIAGGAIRSIALNAAFRAAEANDAIGMAHVLWAARQEYAKSDRALSDSEVRGWL